MRCLKCGSVDDRVVDSRMTRDGSAIRRRRECLSCGGRFTTYEILERRELFVVKRDQSRQRFDRAKLVESINKAVEKRPISRAALDEAVEAIVSDLEALQEREVSSERIGLEVMKRLQTLDPVAYVRFASVYREFQDVGQFIDAVAFLERNQEPAPGHPELFSPAPGRAGSPLSTPTG